MANNGSPNNEFTEIAEFIETTKGIPMPRHKRKALAAVLLDTAPPPPTRAQLDNFGAAMDKLGQQVQTVFEQIRELRGACEEAPAAIMKARRERMMFALSVIKRVAPAKVHKSSGELAAEAADYQARMQMQYKPGDENSLAPQSPFKDDPDVAKVRAAAGGILDRFMGGEGEHLIADAPITQLEREQVTMALDLLTSIPNSSEGGDAYCDHVRGRACKTILGFLDPDAAARDRAWAAAGAPA